MSKYVPLIGRILISAVFIVNGLFKLLEFQATQQYMAAFGIPMTATLAVIAIIIELGGGLCILFGFKTKASATIVALYLIIVALIFHTNFTDQNQQIQFMKDLAIVGGLLYIASCGPGQASIDMKK